MILNIISMFGGLALFLYGMHLMSDSLKESSSGTLKTILEKVTNNPVKAFFLGVIVTALIQSSKATIVITAGLVGAGVLSFRQSLGVIVGANVGTTITGQIISLLDMEDSGGGIGSILQPSTLAPLALVAGICLIMFFKFRNSRSVGNILMGFGILFTGLLNMTAEVDILAASGAFDSLIGALVSNPFTGYISGAVLAFILQSSSASVGVFQAFSSSGQIVFSGIFVVILGIYLGECLTTYLVAAEGGKSGARRVGMAHVVYTCVKSVLSLIGTLVCRYAGLLDGIWDAAADSGTIANINTVFNLASAVIIFPMLGLLEKAVTAIVKDEQTGDRFSEMTEKLSPAFFATPAIALGSVQDVLNGIFDLSRGNLLRAFSLIGGYDRKTAEEIETDEAGIDRITDSLCSYIVDLSSTAAAAGSSRVLSRSYKMAGLLENMGDQAKKTGAVMSSMQDEGVSFSDSARAELGVLTRLTEDMLDCADAALRNGDLSAAARLEAFRDTGRELIDEIKDRHLERLTRNECTVEAGVCLVDILELVDYVLAACANIGMAVLAGAGPGAAESSRDYRSAIRAGEDEDYNRAFEELTGKYSGMLWSLSGEGAES